MTRCVTSAYRRGRHPLSLTFAESGDSIPLRPLGTGVPCEGCPVYEVDEDRHFHADHAGAFQIGIGFGLIAALLWNDALGAALIGFVAASGLHTWSHFADRHIGGHGSDVPLLGATTLLGIAEVVLLMRRRNA